MLSDAEKAKRASGYLDKAFDKTPPTEHSLKEPSTLLDLKMPPMLGDEARTEWRTKCVKKFIAKCDWWRTGGILQRLQANRALYPDVSPAQHQSDVASCKDTLMKRYGLWWSTELTKTYREVKKAQEQHPDAESEEVHAMLCTRLGLAMRSKTQKQIRNMLDPNRNSIKAKVKDTYNRLRDT